MKERTSIRAVLGICLLVALVGEVATSNVVVAIDEPSHSHGAGVPS